MYTNCSLNEYSICKGNSIAANNCINIFIIYYSILLDINKHINFFNLSENSFKLNASIYYKEIKEICYLCMNIYIKNKPKYININVIILFNYILNFVLCYDSNTYIESKI